jgi:hypothetical protein
MACVSGKSVREWAYENRLCPRLDRRPESRLATCRLEHKLPMYKDYEEFKKLGFKLNMSRGKPSSEQLDLSIDMINGSVSFNPIASDGIDCRNYGGLLGLPEARELFGTLLGVPADQVVVAGNSSL